MASILILSEHGDGIPIALRLADENHIVKLWIKDNQKRELLETIKNPSQVSNPKAMCDQYDLILCDTPRLGLLCDELVEKKKLVVGGGSFNDNLTLDIKYQSKVMKTLFSQSQNQIKGINITTEGWFNGKEFVRPFSHSIKGHKELMGVVIWPTNGDKLTIETVEKLTPLLEKVCYVGPISVSHHTNETECSIQAIHPHFNFSSFSAWIELFQYPLFEYFYNLTNQQKTEVPFFNELAMSVELTSGIINVPPEAKKHVWLANINYITARGITVRECQRRIYRTINNLIQSKDVDEEVERLKGQGWL